ncbi:MAG: disulfide bond formation protein B [Acidimicrobiales bacterium]|nr:disulfide bond formation protein B [Acidimicrobiales bacterium]
MTVEAFSTFFAVLALACWIGVIAVVVLAAIARRSEPDGALGAVWDDLGRAALPLAWVIALVTTVGSLYYSKVQGYPPCELCWYQRIAVYPFSVILAIAAWRRDGGIRVYAIPVLAIGAVIAAYNHWIQAYPPESGTAFCTADTPCTARYVWEFGFVSLPFMALSACAFMIALLAVARPTPRPGRSLEDSHE